jgi:hypothetical protein
MHDVVGAPIRFVPRNTYKWISDAATQEIRNHWGTHHLLQIRWWADIEFSKGSRRGEGSEGKGSGVGGGTTLKRKASVEAMGISKEAKTSTIP